MPYKFILKTWKSFKNVLTMKGVDDNNKSKVQ